MYVCCCVGCVRLSRCVWMRMVLGGGRRGALLSPGWEDVYMDVDGVGGGRRGALLSPG